MIAIFAAFFFFFRHDDGCFFALFSALFSLYCFLPISFRHAEFHATPLFFAGHISFIFRRRRHAERLPAAFGSLRRHYDVLPCFSLPDAIIFAIFATP